MSRLDYCNSVLAGLPTSTLQPLQRVQNAAARARLMFGLSRSDHVTPTLIQLHWLPVSYRIKLSCVASSTSSATVAARRIWRKQFSQSAPADHAHLPPHRWTTLYRGCAGSLASRRSHMRVLPPGTLCSTVADPVKFQKLLKSHYCS